MNFTIILIEFPEERFKNYLKTMRLLKILSLPPTQESGAKFALETNSSLATVCAQFTSFSTVCFLKSVVNEIVFPKGIEGIYILKGFFNNLFLTKHSDMDLNIQLEFF